ncbi:hypothetical protein ACPW7J_00775 [Ihubacter sp. rT4E-8]|uniref:hypothetical protein n=1 Tax=Ihubacter sp. rT4E-8 TaxID=3242369 RepID=UPI003CEA9742
MRNKRVKQGLHIFNILATAFCTIINFYLFTVTFDALYVVAVVVFVLACKKSIKGLREAGKE